MIRQVLNTSFFYFSYSYDLSHTLQRLHSMPPEFLHVIEIILIDFNSVYEIDLHFIYRWVYLNELNIDSYGMVIY